MTYIDYDIIFYVQISQDIHVRGSIEIVHATAQAPIICKNTNLVHTQHIITANPYPIFNLPNSHRTSGT